MCTHMNVHARMHIHAVRETYSTTSMCIRYIIMRIKIHVLKHNLIFVKNPILAVL